MRPRKESQLVTFKSCGKPSQPRSDVTKMGHARRDGNRFISVQYTETEHGHIRPRLRFFLLLVGLWTRMLFTHAQYEMAWSLLSFFPFNPAIFSPCLILLAWPRYCAALAPMFGAVPERGFSTVLRAISYRADFRTARGSWPDSIQCLELFLSAGREAYFIARYNIETPHETTQNIYPSGNYSGSTY